jgi:RNA polymerase sigma-70 factor (ECF subfamily)
VTPHAATFEAVRPRLFGIAYRTLESAADADDVVQDTWIRWQGTDRNRVRDAAAFLATTTKRLALNVAQSARVRRETSIDPWDPEPVDVQADPTLGAERREALERAMRMLMEKLSPTERAAYVLREAFDYPYRQIADVLATSEANARQLVTRARLHLASAPRRQVSAAEQQRFIDAFAHAAQTGDLTTLEQLLAAHGRPGATPTRSARTLGGRLGSPTDARGAPMGDLRRPHQRTEGTS